MVSSLLSVHLMPVEHSYSCYVQSNQLRCSRWWGSFSWPRETARVNPRILFVQFQLSCHLQFWLLTMWLTLQKTLKRATTRHPIKIHCQMDGPFQIRGFFANDHSDIPTSSLLKVTKTDKEMFIAHSPDILFLLTLAPSLETVGRWREAKKQFILKVTRPVWDTSWWHEIYFHCYLMHVIW